MRFRRVPIPALPVLTALGGLVAGCASSGPAAPAPATDGGPQAPVFSPDSVTAADYARAESFLVSGVGELVLGSVDDIRWLDDGRVAYTTRHESGTILVVLDPATGERTELSPQSPEARSLTGAAEDGPGRDVVVSPDGRMGAFIRGHDLWVRDLETGDEHRLTEDGVEHYGYATNNAGWTRSDRPVLRWSPDSRRIATFRHDARGVGEMYLVSTKVGHPELDAWRYPLPEDSVIFRIERVIFDVTDPSRPGTIWLDMSADPHRSTVCDHVYCGGTLTDVEWAADATELAFVSSSRDHRRATLRVADAETGAVRDVLEETVPTFFESGYRTYNWRFLPGAGEVVWYSRWNDWGHLYLYDLATGALERPITEGDWNVLQVRRLDSESRTVWFTGNGREPGDPYFHYLYRVGLDDGDVTLLTPDSAHHEVSISPDGEYFVDSWSSPTKPPVTVLRDAWTGEVVREMEAADASRLLAEGWQPPRPFSVKARDGRTDLYGLMFTPTWMDESVKYPLINYIYPGPQSGSVGSRSFTAARRDHQAMAELGFVVVTLDAMGTPQRSRSFHEAYYGNMGDNGLPDQMTAIEQLAERHEWIDLDRVGVWGHSGGGFAAADAILRYPDFYHVAVSQAGNHDNRNYEDDWGEKWQGLLEEYGDGTTNYDNQANQLLAEDLEGKLLLAHGLMDDNVPPSSTLLVVEALIEANQDFDLILFPDARHGFAMHPYMIRRRWDYFVEHLLGAEPPPEYAVGAAR
jgi:dipeptidyl-peptidase-4